MPGASITPSRRQRRRCPSPPGCLRSRNSEGTSECRTRQVPTRSSSPHEPYRNSRRMRNVMNKANRDWILQAAAKALACEIFAAASYGRTHAPVNVEKFDHDLRLAIRQWRAARENLKVKK